MITNGGSEFILFGNIFHSTIIRDSRFSNFVNYRLADKTVWCDGTDVTEWLKRHSQSADYRSRLISISSKTLKAEQSDFYSKESGMPYNHLIKVVYMRNRCLRIRNGQVRLNANRLCRNHSGTLQLLIPYSAMISTSES